MKQNNIIPRIERINSDLLLHHCSAPRTGYPRSVMLIDN
jgi:hypothetical protein